MIPVLFALSPVTAMFPIVRTMKIPIVLSAARLSAALLLHHAAQFLHLPRERANLAVHRLQRRACAGRRATARRERGALRHAACTFAGRAM